MFEWILNTYLIIQGFFVIVNLGYYFEPSKNLSNVASILFKYLEQKFSL